MDINIIVYFFKKFLIGIISMEKLVLHVYHAFQKTINYFRILLIIFLNNYYRLLKLCS